MHRFAAALVVASLLLLAAAPALAQGRSSSTSRSPAANSVWDVEDAGRTTWQERRVLPTANAALLGFLAGGAMGGAALFSSTAFAINALVLSIGTGAWSPPPPPLVGALMAAGFFGAPLLIVLTGGGAVAAVGAALWWGEAGWVSILLGAGTLLVAGALALPVAVMSSMMLAMMVVAPTLNWQGALGPTGTTAMMAGAVGPAIAVVSVAGGVGLGGITAAGASAGDLLQHSFE